MILVPDENVMNLLEMARMWDVKPVTEMCQRYLQKDSYRTMENLLEIAVDYELEDLKVVVMNYYWLRDISQLDV